VVTGQGSDVDRIRTPSSRRTTWHPGRRLRAVLLAVVAGSAFGLVFGLGSLNRPLLNALVFYALGGAAAAALAGLVVLCVPRRGGRGGRRRWWTHRADDRRSRGRSLLR
jgi:hypothetical protein